MAFHFITYGDKKFTKSKKRIVKEAKAFGVFSSIKAYDPSDLPNWFCKKFQNILSEPRGGGYWIWRPIIVNDTFQKMKDGDYLLFMDAGSSFNKQGMPRFNEYIKMLDESNFGVLSFQMNGLDERNWNTKEIFKHLNVDINGEIALSGQHVGGIFIIKKNEHGKKFMEEYLKIILENPILCTDYYNDKGQGPYFKDHRHEQSITSILKKQMGSVVLPDETFFQPFGSEESLKYPFWATRIKE
jgi:hypothetical protein